MAILVSTNSLIISNSIVFGAFLFIAYVIFYLGRKTHEIKKMKLVWVFLSLGIVITGSSFLIQILVAIGRVSEIMGLIFSQVLILAGSSLAFESFIILYLERTDEIYTLQRRQKEILEILKKLKGRYFRKEISEEELKKMYADFIKELTEIEVKLKEIETVEPMGMPKKEPKPK